MFPHFEGGFRTWGVLCCRFGGWPQAKVTAGVDFARFRVQVLDLQG